MSTPFQVSDKVVCVDATNTAGFRPRPKEGRVYVVRDVLYDCLPDDGLPGLQLVGILGLMVNNEHSEGEECLCAERFRLLSEVQAENAERARSKKKGGAA